MPLTWNEIRARAADFAREHFWRVPISSASLTATFEIGNGSGQIRRATTGTIKVPNLLRYPPDQPMPDGSVHQRLARLANRHAERDSPMAFVGREEIIEPIKDTVRLVQDTPLKGRTFIVHGAPRPPLSRRSRSSLKRKATALLFAQTQQATEPLKIYGGNLPRN